MTHKGGRYANAQTAYQEETEAFFFFFNCTNVNPWVPAADKQSFYRWWSVWSKAGRPAGLPGEGLLGLEVSHWTSVGTKEEGLSNGSQTPGVARWCNASAHRSEFRVARTRDLAGKRCWLPLFVGLNGARVEVRSKWWGREIWQKHNLELHIMERLLIISSVCLLLAGCRMISRDIWWLWVLIKLHSGGVKSSEAESHSHFASQQISQELPVLFFKIFTLASYLCTD